MREKINKNSLFFKILTTVVVGIICVSVSISVITINITENIFTETYRNSQANIFNQIYDDIYDFHSSVVKVINLVETNWAYSNYLTSSYTDDKELSKTIFYVQNNMKESLSDNLNNVCIFIIGLNEKSFINNDDSFIENKSDILANEITVKSLENKDDILYQYADSGFTSSTKNQPVIIITKAIVNNVTDETLGVLYMTIKESDFEKLYDNFTSEMNDIVLLNDENIIVSSNLSSELGKENSNILTVDEKDKKANILIKDLSYSHLKICGIIDTKKAVSKMYDVKKIIFVAFCITAIVLLIIFYFIKNLTTPLSNLVKSMTYVRKGDFHKHVEVGDIQEVKELSTTFNYMVDDLNEYVDKLVEIQKEKRTAEINALQMQINPHYIFNTLASVKWLIWQGNKEKSIQVIDAFILLLRNTISNKDEFITIKDEIINIKNYAFINNTRYGDDIVVEYYVMEDCEEFLLPKLILQPFIENAFFHAFPSEQKGRIQIFIRQFNEDLRIEIVDNGVGMDEIQLSSIRNRKKLKDEHFTGIGVKNVDDRLKLIYGDKYGVNIVSEVNKGTKIIITLPQNKV